MPHLKGHHLRKWKCEAPYIAVGQRDNTVLKQKIQISAWYHQTTPSAEPLEKRIFSPDSTNLLFYCSL